MVSLRDVDNVPAGVIRAYVSELYQEVYDAANAAHRPDLDVRILLPEAGASCSIGSGSGSNSKSSGSSSISHVRASNGVSTTTAPTTALIASAPGAAAATAAAVENPPWNAAWATREVAELEPDLEVLFSDEFSENGQCDGGGSGDSGRGNGGDGGANSRQSTLNTDRARAGFPPLAVVSLEAVAKRAYTADYFYAENVLAEIPAYSSVSRFSRRAALIYFRFFNSYFPVNAEFSCLLVHRAKKKQARSKWRFRPPTTKGHKLSRQLQKSLLHEFLAATTSILF